MPADLRLIACPRPFSTERIDRRLVVGGTVVDILDAAGLAPALRDCAQVWIGDQAMRRDPLPVPREHWHRVRPKPGMLLTVRVVPQGGGGGKNPLRAIMMIAIAVLAVYTGGLAAGLFGGMTTLAGATAAAVVSTAVTMVGGLLINAIAPPPRPKLGDLALGGPQSRTSPTLSITGTQNRANRYGAVPRVYGRHKVYPVLAAHPYTEVQGNDQYFRMLFDFGYGPLQLTDMRIGTVPLDHYEDVETQVREGHGTDPAITLYSNTVREDQYSLKLTEAGGAQVLESRDDADEILIDIIFQGLVRYNNEGNRQSRSVTIRVEYRAAGTVDPWTLFAERTYTAATEQMVRRGERIVPATAGRYELRLTRLSPDNTSPQIRDDSFVTAVRSVEYTAPVSATGRCMVAMRIRATDQLHGIVDQFSAVAQALLPVFDGTVWTAPQATRHPAWAYCDVLRGSANRRAVADERLDANAFKAWSDARPDDTFDAVIDYPTTVFELLRDIAAGGRAAFGMRDGKFSVVRDVPQTVPVQHFTPRNSTGFRGSKTFVHPPHALKVRFVNPEHDWQQDEVIVYADGYDAATASRFETLELFGCTDPDLAWKHGRYHLAVGKLRPETFEVSCDVDHLVCTAGDLVKVSYDVPLWGGGFARVRSVARDGNGDATAVTLDDVVTMETGTLYAVRFRLAGGASMVASVLTQTGTYATLTFVQPVPAIDAPGAGDLAMFGEAERESADLLVKAIRHAGDLRATLTLVDAAPAVHDADTGPIPDYDPQITGPAPTEYQEPAKPVIAAIDSGTEVLTIDASGQVQSQVRVTLAPQASALVPAAYIQAQYRRDDSEEAWTLASPAPADARSILLGPVDDGVAYTIRLRAVSATGRASAWASVAHTITGKTESPADVAGFVVNVLGDAAHLSWDAVGDLDLSHYRIKFTPVIAGGVWSGALDLVARIAKPATSAVVPAMAGTYLIKAVDIGGHESANATLIVITSGAVVGRNVVETVAEHPPFAGARTDCVVDSGDLILDSDASGVLPEGSYTFANAVDLGAVYTSRVTGKIKVLGENVDNLIKHWSRLADVESLSGAEPGQYNAWLELRTADDDPAGSPAWSAWRPMVIGDVTTRAFQFRAQLRSTNTAVTPRIDELSATVDMPDRVDGAHDVACPDGGVSVSFSPAFRATPAIAVSGQDMATGDVVEVTGQSASSFTVRFKDAGGGGVARTFDWVARGYGHQQVA